MADLLDQLIQGLDAQQLEQMLPPSQQHPDSLAAAQGAVTSMLVRGLAEKAGTAEGAGRLWEIIQHQVQQGNLSREAQEPGRGTQVRHLDPSVTDAILEAIFGEKAKDVEHRIGKVITLDPETTKKIIMAVLPVLLSALFGKAEAAPQPSPEALPDILGQARKDLDRRLPKSGGILNSILDRDHDGDVDLGDLIAVFRGRAPAAPPSDN